ncbi:PAS domain-containing protein [Corallococcus exercitus]|uniref:PAS domain-containing protein n=1 Tax=Corallococcus exercitus TaxID=2316736 RepID=UPI0035D40321
MSSSPASPFAIEALNPDGFLVLRPEGGRPDAPDDFLCEYANPAAQALLGDGLEDAPFLATRRTWMGLRAAWGMTLATGLRSEQWVHWDTGSRMHTLRVRAARARDGRLYVWLTEQALEPHATPGAMSELDLCAAAVEHLPDACIALDGRFQVRMANPAAERLLGQPHDRLEGRVLWEMVEEEQDLPLRQPLLHALATGQSTEFEAALAPSRRFVRVRGIPVASGLLLYLEDTSPQRRVGESPRHASALFHAVMHGSTDAIYTKNLEGQYTRINAAGAQLMGRKVEEVVGHTDAELWPAEARASVAHDREVLAFRRTLTYEEAQSGQPGRVWLSTKGVLRDEQGRVFGLFGISRDITERKRMEEALHQNEARLQQALRAASVTLFDLRMPEGLLRWGPGAAELLGQPSLPPEEPLAALLARLHPEDRMAVAARLASSTRPPVKLALDFRVVGARGEVRRLTLWGEAHAGDAREQRISGVLVDMTRRTLAPPSEVAA